MKTDGSLFGSISRIAKLTYEKGWAEGGAGNISVLLAPDEPNPIGGNAKTIYTVELKYAFPALSGRQALISTSRSRMRDIAVSPLDHLVLLRVDDDGKTCFVLGPLGGEASSELALHICIMAALSSRGYDSVSVIHAHAHFSALLPQLFNPSSIAKMLHKCHTEMPLVFPGGIGVVELLAPGGWKLAASAGKAAATADSLILTRHGTVCYDLSLDEAFDKLEVLEKAARSLYLLHAAGIEPDTTPWPREFLD